MDEDFITIGKAVAAGSVCGIFAFFLGRASKNYECELWQKRSKLDREYKSSLEKELTKSFRKITELKRQLENCKLKLDLVELAHSSTRCKNWD